MLEAQFTELRPKEPKDVRREPGSLGLVWIKAPYSSLSLGLEESLKAEARGVHRGQNPPPDDPPSLIVFCTEDVASEAKHLRALFPGVPSVLFGLRLELGLAGSAIKAGTRGFIHAGMRPEQIARALRLAAEGEVVIPRELLYELLEEPRVDFEALTSRQLEVLELVVEGLSNAQIARRLFVSESTVKQHLRGAYKTLGVKSRLKAASLLRRGGWPKRQGSVMDLE